MREFRLDRQDRDPVQQGAVVEHDARHDADPESQPDHADDRLVARHLRIDARTDAHCPKPGIGVIPRQAGFRQDHRHAFPLRGRRRFRRGGQPVGAVAGRDEDQRRGRQRLECQGIRQATRARGDGDVLVLGLNTGNSVRRIAGMQLDLDARMALAKLAQQAVEKAVAGGDRAVDADLAGQLAGFRHQRGLHRLPLLQRLPRVGVEQLTLPRQRDMAVVAFEQGDAERFLELADRAAQCRWADMAGIAGPAEVQMVGQGQKLGERAVIHGFVADLFQKMKCRIANIAFYATSCLAYRGSRLKRRASRETTPVAINADRH